MEGITTQPPVPESMYAPFSLAEFQIMAEEMKAIGSYLPEHQMNIMWERCTRIRGQKENQPCGCKSAGGLWAKCVEDINNFISQRA
jgi:hypothetical protein